MSEKKELTVHNTSAPTDAERSTRKSNTAIITDFYEFCNTSDEYFEEMQKSLLPGYLKTVSMDKLYDTVYESRPPVIDGLLYPGTYLFAGAPKQGKSFMMAQFAYHISTGTPLWGYEVHKGTVLYMALEDDYRRLQQRMYRMFGADSTDNLYLSIQASPLGSGLDEQLSSFVSSHPDTKVIIIDTLQKIREVGNDKYSYSNDYEVITRLKSFSDAHGLCLLLVHHTRKQPSDDPFDMISGTNGLLGAADGAFVLKKEKRTSNEAILEISGRDQPDQRLHIRQDKEKLIWNLESVDTELWKEIPDPIIEKVAAFITPDNPSWTGSPTELAELLGVDIQPNVLTYRLNVNAGKLASGYGIRYASKRTHDGRKSMLLYDESIKA